MSEARAKILRQRPFAPKGPGERLPEAAEVEAALRECVTGGVNDRDSARVVAYAWYHGVENDTVLDLIRKAGPKDVLLRELSAHKARNDRDDAELVASLAHRGDLRDLVRSFGDPDLGWALAVISAVELADFGALVSSLDSPEDAMRLIPLYQLATVVPVPFRVSVAKTFLGLSDSFFQDVFVALVCRWTDDAIMFADHPMDTILSEIEAAAKNRVVITGAMFDHVLRRYRHARLPDDEQARLNDVWQLINSAGKRVIRQAADIDAVLTQAGRPRDLEVLAAMSEWRNDSELASGAASYMGKQARDFLQRGFKSAMYDLEGQGPDGRFSESIMEPLIRALKFDGIDVELFRNLHERLASDAFSRMTRFGTWLNDRRRAVALIVVAGMVARERSDQVLLSAVARASAELLSQPPGLQPVLKADAAKQIAAALGFAIPSA